VNERARLWHPWLRIERIVRLADRALRAVLVQRRAIERAGWFN
jgi:hypothetical protein